MLETRKRICGDVLLVPVGLTGHINPMMYVAKQLMERGLTVTMMLSEDELSTMKSHIDLKDNESFHLELVASRTKMRGGEHGLLGLCTNFERVCEPFLNRVLVEQRAGGEGPRCMIADQFMAWSQSWATKLQIPRFVSIVSPATFGYAMYNHSANIEKGLLKSKEKDPVVDLPGIPTVRLGDLSGSAKYCPEFLTRSGDGFDESEGLLMNTFYDLESRAIDAFGAQIQKKGGKGPKLLPIGPMLPPEFFSESAYDHDTAASTSKSECIRWLDTRPASSVVHVAFGSQEILSPRQILELAKGLEASKESFLWVVLVKAPRGRKADVSTLLPPGFQERTKDRGFVYPEFAPQLQILSHPATGGFLTHCGWNSSQESICRGVPMIAWPRAAEQKLCCRVLVDQAKVAIEIRPGLREGQLVTSAEVEMALKLLMTEPKRRELKTIVVELQSRARAAMAQGGSSRENFNTLVETIQSRHSRLQQQKP